jgi:pimeloyl-ACP methyl ester carboxylesterase
VADIVRLEVATGSFQALTAGPDDGALVLVLHGFPDVPSTSIAMVEALASRGFRVIAPWMRGYSPSTVVGPYAVEALAADVLAWADHLAPGRPIRLIGHDWGAVVTYATCALAPDRVAAAVTLSVPHQLRLLRAMVTSTQALRSWYVAFAQLPGAEKVMARHDFAMIDGLWRRWSPGYRLSPDLREQLHFCLRASWPAPLDYYRALVRPVRPALRRLRATAAVNLPIRVPLLYLHGADDGCISPAVGRGAARHFVGRYRAQTIAGAGHFLPAERPTEVADLAGDWFARPQTSTEATQPIGS